ncbi:MAG: ribonuclease HI [Planctomycetota bacterium]|jgi:ribonuclease HI
MKKISIYTDGACSGNPGPGGWGSVIICHNPQKRKEISGAEDNTTNNRMELLAVIESLEILKYPCEISITTDSKYVHDAFAKNWIGGWQKNGWITAAKKPVKNQDLWQRLLQAKDAHVIEWNWIKGHSNHPENEKADQLAVKARENLVQQ